MLLVQQGCCWLWCFQLLELFSTRGRPQVRHINKKKTQTTKSETVTWVIALVNVSSVLIIPHFTLTVIIPTSNSVTVTVAAAVFTLTF